MLVHIHRFSNLQTDPQCLNWSCLLLVTGSSLGILMMIMIFNAMRMLLVTGSFLGTLIMIMIFSAKCMLLVAGSSLDILMMSIVFLVLFDVDSAQGHVSRLLC